MKKQHACVIPNRPHEAARKNPKREIGKVSLKLKNLFDLIQLAVEGNANDDLIILNSRLLHVQSRLIRLKKSKVVATEVTETIDKTTQLLEFINEIRTLNKPLNESIGKLQDINPGTDDNEDIETDVESVSYSGNSHSSSQSFHHNTVKTNPPSNAEALNQPGSSRMVNQRINSTAHFQSSTQAIPDPISNLNLNNLPCDDQPPQQYLYNFPPTPRYNYGRSLSKWNISFDGSPTGINVKRFLVRVEHLAKSEDIIESRLVNELHYVLRGTAVEWYWTLIERNKEISWSALKTEIKKRFQDRRSDFDIRYQIDSRKQRPRDSFYEFYNDLISLSLQLETPLTDAEIMRIIRQNMRPGLQDRLTEVQFSNVDDMVRRCVAHEDTWNRTGFVPELLCQQKRHVSEIATQSFSNLNIEENLAALKLAQNPATNLIGSSTPTSLLPPRNCCWNCLQPNHFYPDCPISIRHKFCFGCGIKGYIKPECPQCCQKSGNLNAGVRTSNFQAPKTNKVMVDSVSNTDPELYDMIRQYNKKQ